MQNFLDNAAVPAIPLDTFHVATVADAIDVLTITGDIVVVTEGHPTVPDAYLQVEHGSLVLCQVSHEALPKVPGAVSVHHERQSETEIYTMSIVERSDTALAEFIDHLL